jgi:hypothetical protein
LGWYWWYTFLGILNDLERTNIWIFLSIWMEQWTEGMGQIY